jgi:hypothetical protein
MKTFAAHFLSVIMAIGSGIFYAFPGSLSDLEKDSVVVALLFCALFLGSLWGIIVAFRDLSDKLDGLSVAIAYGAGFSAAALFAPYSPPPAEGLELFGYGLWMVILIPIPAIAFGNTLGLILFGVDNGLRHRATG